MNIIQNELENILKNQSKNNNLTGGLEDIKNNGIEAVEQVKSGSTIIPAHTDRKMDCLIITYSELSELSGLSTQSSFFFSISSFFAALYLDIFKDTLLATTVSDQTQITLSYVYPILSVLALASFAYACYLQWYRHNKLRLIKREQNLK